jgi:hypothetical protein
MFHWELRSGLVEEKTARLAADMRRAEPSRPRRAAGRLLIAAGERWRPTAALSRPAACGSPDPSARHG